MEGALKDYNEAVRLKPDYAEAFNNRGIARRAKGDAEGALKDYSEAIRLKPDFAGAFNNRGLRATRKGDVEGALQDYSEAIRLKPDLSGPSITGVSRATRKATWTARCRITARPYGSSRTMPRPSSTGACALRQRRHGGRAAGLQRGYTAQAGRCQLLL